MLVLPPPGYAVHEEGSRALVARESKLELCVETGMAEPSTWQALPAEADPGAGRGATLRAVLGDGTPMVLKKLRRGGLVGPLWRDRHASLRRLLANLTVPEEAHRRGVATPMPVALLARRGRLGLYEAWLATEELSGAVDLLSLLAKGPPPGREQIGAAMDLVRQMHDAGIQHRDLNLGNLLLRPADGGEREAFVIDLDRAVLHERPLSFSRRQSALRRLERSYVKNFGELGPLGDGARDVWYELYAGGDPELGGRLETGRRAGRLWLALHRLGRKS